MPNESESTPVENVEVDPSALIDDTAVDSSVEESESSLSEEDMDELEYQAAMRKIRGEEPEEEQEAEESEKTEEEDPEDGEEEKSDDEQESKKKDDFEEFKLKSGKTIKVDMNDRDTVVGLIQKGVGATEKFQEAAEMRKNAETFVNALKENPFKVLSHPSLQLNIRELAENYLWGEIQKDNMSPEEKAAAEREERLKAYEEAERMQKEEQAAKLKEARLARAREELTAAMSKSFEKHNLPTIPWTLEETAKRMQALISSGVEGVTPDDVIPQVKEDYLKMKRSMIDSLDEDKLVDLLGNDVVKKLNKYELKKYKQSKFTNKQPVPDPEDSGPTSFNSIEDYQEFLRKKHR